MIKETQQPDADNYVALEIPARDADKYGVDVRPASEFDQPEQAAREMWTRQGVSTERQDELIAGIAAKAQPGAQVGPFVVGEAIEHAKADAKETASELDDDDVEIGF